MRPLLHARLTRLRQEFVDQPHAIWGSLIFAQIVCVLLFIAVHANSPHPLWALITLPPVLLGALIIARTALAKRTIVRNGGMDRVMALWGQAIMGHMVRTGMLDNAPGVFTPSSSVEGGDRIFQMQWIAGHKNGAQHVIHLHRYPDLCGIIRRMHTTARDTVFASLWDRRAFGLVPLPRMDMTPLSAHALLASAASVTAAPSNATMQPTRCLAQDTSLCSPTSPA